MIETVKRFGKDIETVEEYVKETTGLDIKDFETSSIDRDVADPFDLSGLDKALPFLHKMIEDGKTTVGLIVDCDVDGFTSSSVFYRWYTELCGGKIIPFIHEKKQHGLCDMMERLDEYIDEIDFVVTPDSSSNDFEYHEMLKEKGIPVLVLDHHLVDEGTQFSDNAYIVNNQLSPNYRNKELVGVGVTWQFCRAYDMRYGKQIINNDKYVDLVAVGLVGDMASAKELENHALIKRGLYRPTNPFIRALLDKQSYSISNRFTPTQTDIAFYITPLINAVIRVGELEEKELMFNSFVIDGLMTESHKRGANGEIVLAAVEMARIATNCKAKQNRIKEKVTNELKMDIKVSGYDELHKILFVRKPEDMEVPQQMTGLIAMQLAALFQKPTVFATLGEDGFYRGSIRGLNNSEVDDFRSTLLNTGVFTDGHEFVSGHPQAAGISINKEKLPILMERVDDELADVNYDVGKYEVDFEVEEQDIPLLPALIKKIDEHKDLWGQQFPAPVVYIHNLCVNASDIKAIGKNGKTLRFNRGSVTFIQFNAEAQLSEIQDYGDDYISLSIIGSASVNEYMGNKTMQIIVRALEVDPIDFDKIVAQYNF